MQTLTRITLVGAMLGGFLSSTSSRAQDTATPLPVITPADRDFKRVLYENDVLQPSVTSNVLPSPDQNHQNAVQRAQAWVQTLQATPAKGIQLDPMGSLYVAAGQDALARQQFATRLSTPGLSLADRAYTLLLATKLFAQPEQPTRIHAAEQYLAQLNQLPPDAMRWQAQGEFAIATAYYYAGDGAAVLTHMHRLVAFIPRLSFPLRGEFYVQSQFVMMADVLSGMPDGRHVIDSLGTWLLSYATPSPELLARNPGYAGLGKSMQDHFHDDLALTALLGRSAPNIVATHWYNAPAPGTRDAVSGATTTSLADGTIHLLEFGDFTCPFCIKALPSMEHIHQTMPSVKVWYVTQSLGFWGNSLCSPEFEAEHLAHFYVTQKHYTFPIALWAGPKDSTAAGGVLPRKDPSFEHYAIVGTPTFVIVDGHGIVRHISSGYGVGITEPMLLRSVRYLIAEATQPSVSHTPPAPTASTPTANGTVTTVGPPGLTGR